MGHRTLIMLNNDHLESLKSDQEIGRRIYNAAIGAQDDFGPVGQVVERAHADTVNLAIIGLNGSFSVTSLSTSYWSNPTQILDLVRVAADSLGFKLVKKPEPKVKE